MPGLSSVAIRGILKRKLDDWVSSIEDDALKEMVRRDAIITGGAVASLLMGDSVNDYDVYFSNKATTIAVAKYYLKKYASNPPPKFRSGRKVKMWLDTSREDRVKIYIKSAGIVSETAADGYEYFETQPDESAQNYVASALDTPENPDDVALDVEVADTSDMGVPNPENEAYVNMLQAIANEDTAPKNLGAGAAAKNKYRPVFMSENAITLSDKIQLIVRFFGNPSELHKNFDYVHCTGYYVYGTGELIVPYEVLDSIRMKSLKYVGSLYPLCSLVRMRKFIKRGWIINAGQIVKIAFNLQQFDLTDLKVLEEQLIGVDQAYFVELIKMLTRDKEEGKTIDANYIIQLIDRMF